MLHMQMLWIFVSTCYIRTCIGIIGHALDWNNRTLSRCSHKSKLPIFYPSLLLSPIPPSCPPLSNIHHTLDLFPQNKPISSSCILCTQMQEPEHQGLIYRYLIKYLLVPSELVVPTRRSLEVLPTRFLSYSVI